MQKIIALTLITAMLAAFGVPVHADGVNLLGNSGFESELTGTGNTWTFTNTGNWYVGTSDTGERVDTEKNSGDYSLMLKNATAGQRVRLSDGKDYTLTAYVKGDGGELTVFYGDGNVTYPATAENALNTETINVTSQWQQITVPFVCSSSQDFVICLSTWDGSTVYVDDVVLEEDDNEYDGGGVVNGNFADGTNGWTVEGSDVSVLNGGMIISGTNYKTHVSQTVRGLENGTYNLIAHTSSENIDGIAYVYAKTKGHTTASTAIPQTANVIKIIVPDIIVENGTCDIGIYAKGSSKVTFEAVWLEKSEPARLPFLKGGEISKLTFVEHEGGKFYRSDGTEADALQIMAENGFNLARIRVLNNPGKGRGDGTYYLPEGYMDEADCLSLARRAKDKGMQILFSFAYSDYWVDGDKQIIPYEWQEYITQNNLSGEAKYQYLENKVYEYTKKVLEDLKAQGTPPQYVAIGNEMQVGILFGPKDNKDGNIYNKPAVYARFLNKGAQAVREILPEAKIVLHSDHGGELLTSRKNFMSLCSSVDFDVIGVSYYPFYIKYYSNKNTTTDSLITEFNTVAKTYDKDVIVMETGYNWTQYTPYVYNDGPVLGQLNDSNYYNDVYGESQEGQRAFLTELYAKLKTSASGRCIGDLYWDPVMIYDGGADHSGGKGIGWAIQESDDWTQDNVVPNSTIFDFNGKAVQGQLAMKYNTNSTDRINITGKISRGGTAVKNTEITFTVNGRKYNTTTDKFGEYIVAVPYPENETLSISAKGCGGAVEKAAPLEGVFVSGVDFTDYAPSEADAAEDTGYIVKLICNSDKDGIIEYLSDYVTDIENPKLYVAMYDEDGKLIACSEGKSGRLAEALTDKSYTVKAFLWDKLKPIGDIKTVKINN